MDNARVFNMSFAGVYPLYIKKVEKKGVDDVIKPHFLVVERKHLKSYQK